MWCVIPAAGRATRLGPRPNEHPKTLMNVGGRPIIDRLLKRLAPVVTDACLVISDLDGPIPAIIGNRRYGVDIHYAEQPQPRGVADAVFNAEGLVAGPFIVAMGDCYYEDPLAPYIDIWNRSNLAGAVLTEPLKERPRDSVGLVWTSDDRVVGIEKALYEGQATRRVSGLVVLPETAFQIGRAISRAQAGELEIEDVIAQLIRFGADFLAIPYRGWRCNINTPEDVARVEQRLATASGFTITDPGRQRAPYMGS